jgi:hypothetical protein
MTSTPTHKIPNWFIEGEPIPIDAKYVKSEVRKENIRKTSEGRGLMPPDYKWDYVVYHLYEVPVESKNDN